MDNNGMINPLNNNSNPINAMGFGFPQRFDIKQLIDCKQMSFNNMFSDPNNFDYRQLVSDIEALEFARDCFKYFDQLEKDLELIEKSDGLQKVSVGEKETLKKNFSKYKSVLSLFQNIKGPIKGYLNVCLGPVMNYLYLCTEQYNEGKIGTGEITEGFHKVKSEAEKSVLFGVMDVINNSKWSLEKHFKKDLQEIHTGLKEIIKYSHKDNVLLSLFKESKTVDSLKNMCSQFFLEVNKGSNNYIKTVLNDIVHIQVDGTDLDEAKVKKLLIDGKEVKFKDYVRAKLEMSIDLVQKGLKHLNMKFEKYQPDKNKKNLLDSIKKYLENQNNTFVPNNTNMNNINNQNLITNNIQINQNLINPNQESNMVNNYGSNFVNGNNLGFDKNLINQKNNIQPEGYY